VVAVALLAAGAASAATGTIGSYQPAEASCLNGRIIVTSPAMNSVPVSYGANVIVIGSSHTQWVAYRAWVYHVESRQWIAGSWKARQTGDDGYSSLFDSRWYDYNARGWAGGSTEFTPALHGTFYVYVQYYWFADQYVGAGSDGGFISVHDYSGGLGMTAACVF
jgi:hypothetical protein